MLWADLVEDMRAHLAGSGAPLTLKAAAGIALRSSGFHCVLIYRLARDCRQRLGLIGRVLSAILFWMNRHIYGCAIAPTAEIDGGLMLPHPQGIVIGPGASIGSRAWIFQNVTIGGAPGREGMPRIGPDARIYAGAVVTGPVKVGWNVMVGANAVVMRDVPDRMLVRCAGVEMVELPIKYRTRDDEAPTGPPA